MTFYVKRPADGVELGTVEATNQREAIGLAAAMWGPELWVLHPENASWRERLFCGVRQLIADRAE